MEQLEFWPKPEHSLLPLSEYDKFIVMFSGGKDSTAGLLHLLNLGMEPSRIELWHQLIDGNEGSALMDWPVTPAYCRAIAREFDIPLYFQWREGGFEAEMCRPQAPIGNTWFETPDGLQMKVSRQRLLTRQKFPQVGSIASGRWCSAKCKIDPAGVAIRNQDRFRKGNLCVVTCERADESPNRKNLSEAEPFNYAAGRHIDLWRPVHKWDEAQVWDIIRNWRVNPHPCYKAGYSRCSCRFCIFGNADQFATGRQADPAGFFTIALYEALWEHTIKRDIDIISLANSGQPYQYEQKYIDQAMRKEYHEQVRIDKWQLPRGAFGTSCGPS